MRKLASFAACLVWLVIVPLLLASPAQGHGDGSSAAVGRNPPDSYPYLNWMDDGTDYDAYIDQAKLWWNDADRVVIGRTTLDSKVDVRVRNIEECDMTRYGYYASSGGYNAIIRFNTCLLEWPGGPDPYPGDGLAKPAASDTRRQRTVVHEFGHAIGLDHNNWNVCNSMLRTSSPMSVTCAQPTAHDIEDVQNMWP